MWAGLISSSLRCRLAGLLLLLVSSTCTAGEGVFLWRVQSASADVYLLGSMHALRETDYPLPAAFDLALEQADEVIFEVNLNAVSRAEMADVMQRYGFYPDGETLETALSADTLAALTEYLDARKIPLARINNLRPWYLAVTVGLGEMLQLGFQPELGIDRHLMRLATQAGKPIGQLETFEEQVRLIAADPPALADYSLRATLDDLPRMQKQLIGLFSAWSIGDAEGLYRLSIATMASRPALAPQLERVLYDRNLTMVRSIKQLLARQGSFLVVVGAMHLGGSKGILAALSDDYGVTQATAEGDYIALE